jgi:predicted nucleotidyltransferase
MSQSILNKHFREFIELLEGKGVRYLVVGGYAVGFHGFPRYTGDLDIFIAIEAVNSEKILEVFHEFGFSDLGLSPNDFLDEDMVVEIGREPMKIQVLTGISGVTFEECYTEKAIFEDGGMHIPIIGLKALLKNKAASGRGKDKIDLEELNKNRGEQGAGGNAASHSGCSIRQAQDR